LDFFSVGPLYLDSLCVVVSLGLVWTPPHDPNTHVILLVVIALLFILSGIPQRIFFTLLPVSFRDVVRSGALTPVSIGALRSPAFPLAIPTLVSIRAEIILLPRLRFPAFSGLFLVIATSPFQGRFVVGGRVLSLVFVTAPPYGLFSTLAFGSSSRFNHCFPTLRPKF